MFDMLLQENQEEDKTDTTVKDDRDPFDFRNKPDVLLPNGKVNVDALSADDDFLNDLRIYAQDRYGEIGQQLETETDREYVGRFLRSQAQMDGNSVYGVGTIDYLRHATPLMRERFGRLNHAWDNTDYNWFGKKEEGSIGFFEKGGARDLIVSALSDPFNIGTLGLGKIFSKAATKTGISALTKGAVTGAGVGAVEGATGDVIGQKIRLKSKTGDKEAFSFGQTALAAGLGATLGAVGGGIAGRGEKISKEDLTSVLPEKKIKKVSDKKLQATIDNLEFDPNKGIQEQNISNAQLADLMNAGETQLQKILKEGEEGIVKSGGEKTDLTEGILRITIQRKMAKVVESIVTRQQDLTDAGLAPSLQLARKEDEKVSDFVNRFIDSVQDDPDGIVDADVLEVALKENNLSLDSFFKFLAETPEMGAMIRKTSQKGGQILQPLSRLSKTLNVLRRIDPEFVKRAKERYGIAEESIEGLNAISRFGSMLDKNRRALMVSKISTTVRNALTGFNVVGMQTAADVLDSALYYGGKSLKAAATGNASFGAFKAGVHDMFRDSFGLIAYLSEQNLSKEAADLLLQNNTKLHKNLFRTLQESGDADQMWWFTKYANTLNLVQDSFFRRAFFMASVDKMMRRNLTQADIKKLGIKTVKNRNIFKDGSRENVLYKAINQGKDVPLEILQKGVNNALEATFAYSPSQKENYLGNAFIRMVENSPKLFGVVPTGTAVFPFARFMVNAMTFQLKYSILNPIYTIGKTGGKRLLSGKPLNPRDLDKMRDSIAKGTVGMAATWAAMKYRIENQDTNWFEYKTPSGSTLDMRPIFPVAPYFFLGDLWAKGKLGRLHELPQRQAFEAFTGANFRIGASSVFIDGFYNLFKDTEAALPGLKDVESNLTNVQVERLGEALGTFAGELTGGFTNNLVLGGLNEIIDMIDDESSVIRDSKMVDGVGALDRAKNAYLNQATKNLPYFKKELPEFKSPTRSETIYKKQPILSFLGFKLKEYRTPAEEELIEHGFESWEIVTPTGDRRVDSAIKEEVAKLIETDLTPKINKTYYKKTYDQRETFIQGELQRIRKRAKERARLNLSKSTDEGFNLFDRTDWLRLTADARRAAETEMMEIKKREYQRKTGGTLYGFDYRGITAEGDYALGVRLGRMLEREGKKR
tara:strand:+ start:11413 stop:14880 length:3468 start_codon:yes stop_codon:yes gene_type:complete